MLLAKYKEGRKKPLFKKKPTLTNVFYRNDHFYALAFLFFLLLGKENVFFYQICYICGFFLKLFTTSLRLLPEVTNEKGMLPLSRWLLHPQESACQCLELFPSFDANLYLSDEITVAVVTPLGGNAVF